MTGKKAKKKWPKWAENNKIRDDDWLYLAGDKIKIFREGGIERINKLRQETLF